MIYKPDCEPVAKLVQHVYTRKFLGQFKQTSFGTSLSATCKHSSCFVPSHGIVDAIFVVQDNVDVRVARIFNTYGPRMHMFDGEPLHI